MRIALLGLAASIAAVTLTAPVQAQDWSGGVHSDGQRFNDPHHTGDRIDLRRDRHRRDNSNLVLDSYGGEWALYNNRSWEADSYNDWWHDRPDRAFPRWMQHNQDCSRQWYSGDTLRC